MVTLVSWYTPEYEKIMYEYLMPSVEKLNIPYKIYRIGSCGNWVKNTNFKPSIAQRALAELNTDILLIDADAKIYEYPKLFEEIPQEYDCGMFLLSWEQWYGHTKGKYELCSGTLYFKNRPICKELIKEWQNISEASLEPDQNNLQRALKKFKDLKYFSLPYEYCWINSMPNGKEPLVKRPNNVVIEHFQSSRTMRRKLNG